MHGEGHAAEDAVGVIHQADKLTQARLSHPVHDALQTRMPVAGLAALHESQPVAVMIDHLLVALGIPPFGREVVLAAREDDPITAVQAGRRGLSFLLRQMNVATKACHRNAQPQLLLQVLHVTVQEVIRSLIALMHERIVHVEDLHAGVILPQGREVGVMFPQGRRRGTHVGLELSRRRRMQITHGRSQHDDVARALERAQDQALHGCSIREGDIGRQRWGCRSRGPEHSLGVGKVSRQERRHSAESVA